MLSKEIRVPVFEWLSGNLEIHQAERLMVPYYESAVANKDNADVISCFELCVTHMDESIWDEKEAKTEMRKVLESLLDAR